MVGGSGGLVVSKSDPSIFLLRLSSLTAEGPRLSVGKWNRLLGEVLSACGCTFSKVKSM